jgi:hypothetical protein
MGNRDDRLTRYGIVALAGIAVLGWVREPERHQYPPSPISATSPNGSAESRRTFYPSAAPDLSGTPELPGDNPESAHVSDAARQRDSREDSSGTVSEPMKNHPVQSDRRSSPVVKTRESAPANTGRHEDPQTVSDDVISRSREPQKGRPEVEVSERPQEASTPMPRADRTDNDNHAQNQPIVNNKKQRSAGRSAAIIVGTAVAGAAIGAATGGGKGAAIGAISGTAGGYVYDRMTRHNGGSSGASGVPDNHSNSQSDDQQGNYQPYDRGQSIARRFGTPGFNVR